MLGKGRLLPEWRCRACDLRVCPGRCLVRPVIAGAPAWWAQVTGRADREVGWALRFGAPTRGESWLAGLEAAFGRRGFLQDVG